MGFNLISGCHRCKTRVFWFRNEEAPVRAFYVAHRDCILIDKKNVQTNIDQIQEEPWMDEYVDNVLQEK